MVIVIKHLLGSSKYKDSARNLYTRFVHQDRTIHYIGKENKSRPQSKSNLQVATEYLRSIKKEVRTYDFRPQGKFVIEKHESIKAIPVVLYDVSRQKQDERISNFVGMCRSCYGHCTHIHDLLRDECNNTTIVWCPKCQRHWDYSEIVRPLKVNRRIMKFEYELKNSGAQVLKLKDIHWFLKTSKTIDIRARNFLSILCKLLEDPSQDFIISYGNTSTEEADRISKLFDCDITYRTDKFGILDRLERKINLRDKQITLCNKPPRTLPNPKDLVTTTAR